MNFNERVYSLVRQIPKGKVASYGQIASLLGNPRSARAVGWAMHQLDNLSAEQQQHYPWWRVINSQGFISTTCQEHTFEMQKDLLEKDKVKVVWKERQRMYWVDMDKYLWNPKF